MFDMLVMVAASASCLAFVAPFFINGRLSDSHELRSRRPASSRASPQWQSAWYRQPRRAASLSLPSSWLIEPCLSRSLQLERGFRMISCTRTGSRAPTAAVNRGAPVFLLLTKADATGPPRILPAAQSSPVLTAPLLAEHLRVHIKPAPLDLRRPTAPLQDHVIATRLAERTGFNACSHQIA